MKSSTKTALKTALFSAAMVPIIYIVFKEFILKTDLPNRYMEHF